VKAFAAVLGVVGVGLVLYGVSATGATPETERTAEWWLKVCSVIGVGAVSCAGAGLMAWPSVLQQLRSRTTTPRPDNYPNKNELRLSNTGLVSLRDVEILAELAERYRDSAPIVAAVIALQHMVFEHRFQVEGPSNVDVGVPSKPSAEK